MLNLFAHTCAEPQRFPRCVAYSGRPSGSVFPRTLTGLHCLGRSMANRTQVSKGTALIVTPARFSACEPNIHHRNPKAQPYCAGCGCWISAYPFNTTNLCESCSTQPEG